MDSCIQEAFFELYNEDGLTIMAPGLGALQLLAKFLILYSSKRGNKLVFCINAHGEEDNLLDLISSQGVLPQNLPKVITNEVNTQEREDMYMQGGCFIITSRIIIVDLLTEKVNIATVCGFLVYNAHSVTEVSMESFILRVFRQGNRTGFIKAFSDDPLSFQNGLGKIEQTLRHLFVQKLYLWPRFHQHISQALNPSTAITVNAEEETHKQGQSQGQSQGADVIELSQSLSPHMKAVQAALLATIESCIQELKKAVPHLDTSSFTLENGLFRSFDTLIRNQLDPEWHKTSPRTKQLVSDIQTLRRLLDYLLRYDAVSFYSFLLTLRSASSMQKSPSLWLTSSAAEQIFSRSRVRIDITTPITEADKAEDLRLDDVVYKARKALCIEQKLSPVLEIPPKWKLLEEVIKEIKTDFSKTTNYCKKNNCTATSNSNLPPVTLSGGCILVLVRDERGAAQLKDVVNVGAEKVMDYRDPLGLGLTMKQIESLPLDLKLVLLQEKTLQRTNNNNTTAASSTGTGDVITMDADTDADIDRDIDRDESTHTTTVYIDETCDDRTVALSSSSSGGKSSSSRKRMKRDNTVTSTTSSVTATAKVCDGGTLASAVRAFDKQTTTSMTTTSRSITTYQLLDRQREGIYEDEDYHDGDETVLTADMVEPRLRIVVMTHSYAKSRATLFSDMKPSYVIMYDADIQLIREIEVYSVSTCMFTPKVYFLIYLSSLSREKKAFESLIEAKSHLVVTPIDLDTETALAAAEASRTELSLDTRTGSGVSKRTGTGSGKDKPVLVLADLREFRSILPSLLHRGGLRLLPITLTVGDFILAPQICVERKGISDLFQSFASGRLYNQADMMSRHYKFPCLLIEFTGEKSFSLQATSDITAELQVGNVCTKMALLLLAFPSLRLLWSRSPHMTVDIFRTLKSNFEEPELSRAVAVGSSSSSNSGNTEENASSSSAVSDVAKEVLLSLPGINVHNASIVMNAVNSIAELSQLNYAQLEPLVGPGNARKLYTFLSQRF
eukprot:gene717-1382_t